MGDLDTKRNEARNVGGGSAARVSEGSADVSR